MQTLAWWLIPLSATVLAIAWVTWRNRPKRPADAHQTLAAHRKFTAALERSECRNESAGIPSNDPSNGSTDDAENDSAARSV